MMADLRRRSDVDDGSTAVNGLLGVEDGGLKPNLSHNANSCRLGL